MRRAPCRLSAYEQEQTRLALAFTLNLSERQRAGHRKMEADMVRRALANTVRRSLVNPTLQILKHSKEAGR